MRAHLLMLGALAACGPAPGTVHARWQVAGDEIEVAAEGRGRWCPSSGMILVDATDEDRAVGVHWHFDSLAPGVFLLELPTTVDSVVTGASAAARYVHLDEVRGYRSESGRLTVQEIDSSTVSGEVTAAMRRLGEPDSITFAMTFDRVPLVADTTLCVASKPAPDTLSDTLAPTPATGP